MSGTEERHPNGRLHGGLHLAIRVGVTSACLAGVMAIVAPAGVQGSADLAGATGFVGVTGVAEAQQRPDYCAVETPGARVEIVRPGDDEPPIDDVNWFARPVPNVEGDLIIGFASHDENYLYNLTRGARIRIPDASDAVATPDGRYMTVPGNYTPDGTVRFYDLPELLDALRRGEDAAGAEPVFVHRDETLRGAYYQSVGVVGGAEAPRASLDPVHHTTYRMIFSGNPDPTGFRMVDYEFSRTEAGLQVTPSAPMKICPALVRNDFNTPFISKDGRYVAAYTSSRPDRAYTDGSSLRIFEITGTDPGAGTSMCVERVDFGFPAGKADFSFDGDYLTFHIAQSRYLVPFVNGGLDAPVMTDVVVAELERDAGGSIVGYGDLARVTTSQTGGVGSYFPAFFPDGRLFYIHNEQPKQSEGEKRFHFVVVEPAAELYIANLFADPEAAAAAGSIGRMWHAACTPGDPPLTDVEAPWLLMSLSQPQCTALVRDNWKGPDAEASYLESSCAKLSMNSR